MNTVLAHNEAVITMLLEYAGSIATMKHLIERLRSDDFVADTGESVALLDAVEEDIRRGERSGRALREALVWKPATTVD